MRLFMKKMLLVIAVFLILVAKQIAADEIVFARHLWNFIGLVTLISLVTKLLKQILGNFFKDLDEFLKK
ncbi:MAG: hypothetical protein ACRC7E_06150 [Cetobacterium sp.]